MENVEKDIKIINQQDDDPPIKVDPQTITHAFVTLVHDDIKFSQKADELITDIQYECQPSIWSKMFRTKFSVFSASDMGNGFPNVWGVPEALKSMELQMPSMIIVNLITVTFDKGITTSNILAGFAYPDDESRIYLVRTNGCVAE